MIAQLQGNFHGEGKKRRNNLLWRRTSHEAHLTGGGEQVLGKGGCDVNGIQKQGRNEAEDLGQSGMGGTLSQRFQNRRGERWG